MEPKVFDLIVHFARHPNQVFSHEDLIEAVWQGRFVSESAISTCIKNARKALGDSGETQRYIKTVRGRGFRFDAQVREIGGAPSDAKHDARPEVSTPALLIQPFRVLADDGEMSQLSSALVADLGRILTRIPLLRISVQPMPIDVTAVGPTPRELHEVHGVDFVLDGTLQRLGERYRFNAQLLDARSGFQLWSDQINLDGPLDKALDEAPIAVIARLEPQLQKAIYASVRSPGGDAGSRQLFLEAASLMVLSGWGHEAFIQAAELLRKSRDLEPDFALAHAFLSLVMGFGDRVGLMSDREQAKAESGQAAERALALDSLDSTVLGYAGCALADIGQAERARPILESAVEISPANAQAWAALGALDVVQGRTEQGIEGLKHGIAISPLDSRLSVWGTILSVGLLQAKRLDDALHEGRLACRRGHRSYLPRVAVAGIYLVRKEPDQAAVSLQEAYRLKSDLSPLQIQSVVGRELSVGLRRLKS